MIGEDVLERALSAAADDYPVPDEAIDRLRDQLAPAVADDEPAPHGTLRRVRAWRPSGHQWVAAGAAGIVVLVVLAFALGGTGGGSGDQGTASAGGGVGATYGAPGVTAPAPVAGGAGTGSAAGGTQYYGPVAGGSGTSGSVDNGPALPAQAAPPVVTGAHTGALAEKSAAQRDAATPARPLATSGTDSARVVKTGELDLRVAKGRVGATLDRLTALATTQRGYVAQTTTDEGGGSPSGEVTMRVPVGAFERTVSTARGFGKVLSLQTSGQDVTAQYTDLQARIKALTATRETFLTILSKARTIGETLAVQQHITDVQTQIDQLTGQLKVLADQSAMAALTVTVDQVARPVAATTHHRSGIAKAVDRSVGRFVRGVEAIIGAIGPILLAVLVVALVWVAARFGYRFVRRQLV